ncbi:MAG: OmpA family protein [Pseudomonadota bacterium]
MEILRNDSGISLIGLVPASMDRPAFMDRIQNVSRDEDVSDFLETADYPAPESWDDTITYAVRALGVLDRTKISLRADRIAVKAITGSQDEKNSIEQQLERLAPSSVSLSLDIAAPRPVITPYTLRFTIDEDGPHFDACSADTEFARNRILSAARRAGMSGEASCLVGLGVPTPRWSEAVIQSIAALAELGQGSVTFTDADISIRAGGDVTQARFDDVIGALENNLPELFSLKAERPAASEGGQAEELEFTATLSPEGLLQLSGRVATETDRTMVDSFAMARFSSGGVDMRARVDDAVPDGWTFRVITGIDALSHLSNGIVSVTPDMLTVRGATGEADASTTISSLLSGKLGEGAVYDINVRYEEELDPVASIPTPQECEADINAIKDARKIQFEPGSARLDVTGKQIMDDIAEVLRDCGALNMEIAGHTDSQGRESMNQQLSQSRAQTVLNELRLRRVLTGSITAVGYGESEPIAENDTEEGREANRRIEFIILHDGQTTGETSVDTRSPQSELETAAEEAENASADGASENADEQN